jgi:CheY-like chemotaxis protein
MDKNHGRPAVILLVEDDPGDQELTRRTFANAKIRNQLYIVGDGEQALDYLFRRGKFRDPSTSPRPDLVLLDLNMPRVDGRQVLLEIGACPQLNSLPVVVMTTSSQETDIVKSYQLGANSYIVKPVGLQEFVEILAAIENYWFEIVVLPREPATAGV